MRTSQKITAAVVGVGLAGAAAVAIPAFAAETTPGATPTSSVTATPDTPKDRAGGLKTSLDTLVKNGTITQAQADKVLAQTQADHAAREGDGRGPGGPGGHGRHGGMGGGKGFGMRGGELLTTAAKTLHLTEDALRTQLQTKSLGDIADAQKVSRATLKAALTKAMTSELSQRVDDLLTRKPGERPTRNGSSPTASPTSSGSNA